MAQGLRAHTVLTENPPTLGSLQLLVAPASGDLMPLALEGVGTNIHVQMFTDTHIDIYIIKSLKFVFKIDLAERWGLPFLSWQSAPCTSLQTCVYVPRTPLKADFPGSMPGIPAPGN